MTYMTPFERYQHENKTEEPQEKKVSANSTRYYPTHNEVMDKVRTGRQDKESPLKLWWLEQEALKSKIST